ncbi:hypothetical protein AV656_11040 [Bhargavaea cecembensis]|uniref:DUF600 domain-containing protein n=1 Tax=Bhargavaea cecembensis TaxID=394098 RepID=A0A161RC78_9BACL|nr:hypothetical protein [Bhargavaea cecembensis]KZE37112.1 hypothetical protein AV656_11040 [Bhargavaea cecembensis]
MKNFEDHLADMQTDMVAVCMEYVDDQADDVYIYCSYEPEMYTFDVFFRINGKTVRKNKLNDAVSNEQFDVSLDRQRALLRIGNENLIKIHAKCKEFGRDMPTEIKLHYDVKKNKLKGSYKYEPVYSNDKERLPDHIFDAWFNEVKSHDV